MSPADLVAQFENLLPLAVEWATAEEARILREGLPLSAEELADARVLGARNAEGVRLLQVPVMPRPSQPALLAACNAIDFLTPATRGLALGHGIFVRSDCWRSRTLIAHELVHVAQYERLGGIAPFLRQYLMECLTVGYPQSPLEQEAISRSGTLADARN
jgi:hypothetical protein